MILTARDQFPIGSRGRSRCRRLRDQTVRVRRATRPAALRDPAALRRVEQPRRGRRSGGGHRGPHRAPRGPQIALSAREYALLEYLAMRRGQVVTRSEIHQHVYDFAAEPASNVVDVYVGYLRKRSTTATRSSSSAPTAGSGTRWERSSSALASLPPDRSRAGCPDRRPRDVLARRPRRARTGPPAAARPPARGQRRGGGGHGGGRGRRPGVRVHVPAGVRARDPPGVLSSLGRRRDGARALAVAGRARSRPPGRRGVGPRRSRTSRFRTDG